MHLFWQQGYEATSLHDLLKAMGLSKSSLYQGFGGKKELFLRCVTRYCEGVSARFVARLAEAESGLDFIKWVLLHAPAEAGQSESRRSCLRMNTASEFAQNDPEIAARVSTAFKGLRGLLQTAILRSQREGEIAVILDITVLAGGLPHQQSGRAQDHGQGRGGRRTQVREIVGVILRALA